MKLKIIEKEFEFHECLLFVIKGRLNYRYCELEISCRTLLRDLLFYTVLFDPALKVRYISHIALTILKCFYVVL